MTNKLLGVQPGSLFMQRVNVTIKKNLAKFRPFSKTNGFDFKSNLNYVVLKVDYAWQNPISASESAM